MTMNVDGAIQNITVPFPISLLIELERDVPKEQQGKFIVQATAHELQRSRLARVVNKLRQRPAWALADHPDLATPEDVDHYVRQMREGWMPRSWDEIVAEAHEEMPND